MQQKQNQGTKWGVEENACLGSPRRPQPLQRCSGRVQQQKSSKSSPPHGQALLWFPEKDKRAACLHGTETSPLTAHKTCFSLHDHSFPWQPCFSIGTLCLAAKRWIFVRNRIFTEAGPVPNRWKWFRYLQCPKYTQCESVFPPLKKATMKTTLQTEKLSFFWISKQSKEGITFSWENTRSLQKQGRAVQMYPSWLCGCNRKLESQMHTMCYNIFVERDLAAVLPYWHRLSKSIVRTLPWKTG